MTQKKLGFGAMRLPQLDKNVSTSIDMELTKQMFDAYLERGFTYFDTAWVYRGGQSERALKEALVERYPREKFTITTKLPPFDLVSFEQRDEIFAAQLEKTGAGYFDTYLLHDINSRTIVALEKFDCFNWIREKKEQGLAKRIGFSFHDSPEMLDKLLTKYPFFDVVQLQINYLDWENAGVQSRGCYEVACKHGKPIIVMEPVKGGVLADVPQEVEAMFRAYAPEMSPASWAIRFAAGLENVEMVLSGMSDMQQVLDNTAYMADFKPLSEEELALVKKAAEIINGNIAVACTGCAYCVDDCPKRIAIPQYFSLYNSDLKEPVRKGWTPQRNYYKTLGVNFGRPEDCIECGLCESRCPQHLPIRSHLKELAEYFDTVS